MIAVTDIRARESFCFMRWSKSSWGFFRWVSCSLFFFFLSTISFSLQLHLKKPWVRGKSLRGFSLAAMTALLMSCSPSGPRCCPSSTTCWTSRQWGRKRSPTYLQYQSGKIQWKMRGRGNRFHSSGCGQIWWMAQGLIGGYHQAGKAHWEEGGGDNEAAEILGGLFGKNSTAQCRTQVNFSLLQDLF